jgi:hypothetical protein
MATKIYNSDLTKELREGAKIQQGVDTTPSELADKVIPVMEVNPKILRRASQIIGFTRNTTATNVDLITPINGKQIFITALAVSNTQDVTSDNTRIAITANFFGITKDIYARRKTTLTASTTFDFIDFSNVLKLDENSSIKFTGAFTVGACSTDVIIFGYFADNINA